LVFLFLQEQIKDIIIFTLTLNLGEYGLGDGDGRVLAEALRLNTTVTSLNLGFKDLGEGGGRALAETLRLNTTVTSLDLGGNDLREELEIQSALGQTKC
jgi:hypothetical protein